MEPITLVMIALTLVATKATEKVGEQLGANVIASTKHLLEVLRRRSPETVLRLSASGASDSVDPIVIDAEIIEEVKRVAAADPEVQAAFEAAEAAIVVEPHVLKLANKIGVVNLKAVQSQTFHQTF
jgi:hypothetical protein